MNTWRVAYLTSWSSGVITCSEEEEHSALSPLHYHWIGPWGCGSKSTMVGFGFLLCVFFFLLDTQIAVSYYIASAPGEQTHKATFFSISSGRTTMTIHTTFNINRKTLSLSVRIRCTTFLTEGKSHWYYSATHRAYKSFILFHTQTLTRIHCLSLASHQTSHQTNCP